MSANAVRQQRTQRSQQPTRQKVSNTHTTRLKKLKETHPYQMALHAKDESDHATDRCDHALPLDSDSHAGDDGSTPYSSPPPKSKNVSFKPFATSRAQRRAIAEKSSHEKLRTNAKARSEGEDKLASGVAEAVVGKAPSNKVYGSTDLKSLIDAAKKKALANNKPRKAERVEKIYQQSLSNKRLTVLLESTLRTSATPEQQSELQRYVNGTKSMTGDSRGAMSNPNTSTKSTTTTRASGRAQAETKSTKETDIVQTAETSIQDPQIIFCASELWPRYCRLPPGRNTTVGFEALTSSKVDDRGQSVPTHPAPDSWLQEALKQLSQLLHVARADKQAWIRSSIATPDYKGQDVHTLLAEEVMWATHHGPYKDRKKRVEIGLLLECVGIERKGTIWKG